MVVNLLVIHLGGLDLGRHSNGAGGDDHTNLVDTDLYASDRHSADTADSLDVMEGQMGGLNPRVKID